jgi:hypothetical protein
MSNKKMDFSAGSSPTKKKIEPAPRRPGHARPAGSPERRVEALFAVPDRLQ